MVWCCDNLCREACAEKRRKAEHAARIAGNFLRTDHAGADRGEHAARPFHRLAVARLAGVVQRRPHCDADFDAAAWPVSADSRHRGERPMVDVVRGRVRCHFPDRQCAAAAETGQSQNRDHASHRADRHGPADRRFRLVRHYRAADFPAAHRRCGNHAGRLSACRRRTESTIASGWQSFGRTSRRFRAYVPYARFCDRAVELRRHRVRHVFGRADGVVGQAGRRVGIAGEGIARLVRGRSDLACDRRRIRRPHLQPRRRAEEKAIRGGCG